MNIFTFIHENRSMPFPRRLVEQTAEAIITGEKLRRQQAINIILCSNAAIKRLNRKHLGRNRATDVIAFEFNDSDFLGEAYISLERAYEQAERFGLKYNEEVNRLFVHAVIHLLGYEHSNPRERAEMEKRESRYCVLGKEVAKIKHHL